MKKAVIVGGSNGIGLSVACNLISKGYHACILDVCEPDKCFLTDESSYTYYNCNLLNYDEELIDSLSADEGIEVLMITAGFGRVADFEYLHPAEINNMFTVNTVSAIKTIKAFYERIKADKPFYCGVMGSIAGLISSPMFSVYAASKAAICRFCESVNIELELAGTKNRILNVSPGSVKGTRFNGQGNDISLTEEIAEQIVKELFSNNTLFIPEYEETYKGVLERYNNDAHGFGISSYEYKKKSGRVKNEDKVVIGYLSGTFDLFHIGHLNLLRRAKEQCDYLIVGIHKSGAWKGKETFIPFEERIEIVKNIKFVDRVVESLPEDSDAYNAFGIHKLFVGSDYKGTERFRKYEEYFADKNVEIVYFPYTKGTSSTQLREKISKK